MKGVLLLVVLFWALPCSSFIISLSRGYRGHSITRFDQIHDSPTAIRQCVDDPSSILTRADIATLNELVNDRAESRWSGDYLRADTIRSKIEAFPTPTGYHVILKDIPRKLGGGTDWFLAKNNSESVQVIPGTTVLQLAHAALGMAVQSSIESNLHRAHKLLSHKQGETSQFDPSVIREAELLDLVNEAKRRLQNETHISIELSGRKAADAAFWFAMAGVSDPEIFESLVEVATQELERFGMRSSCRSKDIFQIMERFAAAGVRSAPRLEELAKQCLAMKDCKDIECIDNLLDFHSDRCLMLIWKFSTKQKKQRAFLKNALMHWERHQSKNPALPPETIIEEFPAEDLDGIRIYDWDKLFDDPLRPLVIDVGCGMGVSMLGIASNGNSEKCKSSGDFLLGSTVSWADCNLVGVDLNKLGVGYANGLAYRWGLNGQLAFLTESAEGLLLRIAETYPGPICLCCIQFPTPFRLARPDGNEVAAETEQGNSQLPKSATDGFMVSQKLLSLAFNALCKGGIGGRLLLQSNCEDVAVFMKKLACEKNGFSVVNELPKNWDGSIGFRHSTKERIPQRTMDWRAMGGERASSGFLMSPILPRNGATETEIACALNGTPVYRCLLQANE